jgi:hypothetical protein
MTKKNTTTAQEQEERKQDTVSAAGQETPQTSTNETGAGAEAEPSKPASFLKVYCKLPNGIILSKGKLSIALKGSYDKAAVAGFGVTEVDPEIWKVVSEAHAKHPAIERSLIFARAVDGESQAKELSEEKTGFEQLSPEKVASGVSPDKELNNRV